MDLEDDENRKAAEQKLENGFQVPLFGFADPPKAWSICMFFQGGAMNKFENIRWVPWRTLKNYWNRGLFALIFPLFVHL